MMDRDVGSLAGINLELLEQTPKADARALVADPDADRAILIMHAQGDHRPLEARISHPGHCQEQLAGEEGRLVGHAATMVRGRDAGKS
jgi:hypothetical protein